MSDPSIQRGPSKEVPCIGYDATTKHAYVPLEAVSVQQDATTGQWYGVLNVNASFSASSIGYVEDIEQPGYIALTSPPSTTNAGSDTVLTFSSQVNRVVIQNNTNANANFDFDQVATAGSFLVGPGGLIVYPKKCTAFHLFTAAAQNINGSSAGNIVVRGSM